MASAADIDALVILGGQRAVRNLGRSPFHIIGDAQTPTLLFPFAPRGWPVTVGGGARSEMEMEGPAVGCRAARRRLRSHRRQRDIASGCTWCCPVRQPRNVLAATAPTGESKSALDDVVARWARRSSWAQRVTIAHALIGWTRGTDLMGHNDAIVDAVGSRVTTYSTAQMARCCWTAPSSQGGRHRAATRSHRRRATSSSWPISPPGP